MENPNENKDSNLEKKETEIKEKIDKAYDDNENSIESEKIEKDFVIEMLKKNGLEDLETRKLLNNYLDQQQELRDENEDIDASQVFNIRLAIDMVDFYIAVGDREGAIENIDIALDQAEHYMQEDLISEIQKRKESLK